MGACFRDSLTNVLLPTIAKGTNVLCERYTMSMRVYQGDAYSVTPISHRYEEILYPDLIILLDISPSVYEERIASREKDTMEDVSLEEINKRRTSYRHIARNTRNAVTIDASLPIDEVVEECYRLIKQYT